MDDVLKAENQILRNTLQLIANSKIADAKECAEIAAGTLAALNQAQAEADAIPRVNGMTPAQRDLARPWRPVWLQQINPI